MSGDCIRWSGDPDMPNVDIKQCHVDIQKCPYKSGDELSGSHVDIKPSDIKSSDPVNINAPLSVLKNVPVLTPLFAPILAPNVPVPPVNVSCVRGEDTHSESESDGVPLENHSDFELVPHGEPEDNHSDSELLPQMKGLQIIEPVPQSEEPLSDMKYQFRRRRTKVVAKQLEESVCEALFEESESEYEPLSEDSDSEYEEPVRGRHRKVGDQIESIIESLSEENEEALIEENTPNLAPLAVIEENENEESLCEENEEALFEENDIDSELVPEMEELVFDIKDQPQRKRRKVAEQREANESEDEPRRKRRKVGEQREANESEDDFENSDSRIAKAKAIAKAKKIRGKSV